MADWVRLGFRLASREKLVRCSRPEHRDLVVTGQPGTKPHFSIKTRKQLPGSQTSRKGLCGFGISVLKQFRACCMFPSPHFVRWVIAFGSIIKEA